MWCVCVCVYMCFGVTFFAYSDTICLSLAFLSLFLDCCLYLEGRASSFPGPCLLRTYSLSPCCCWECAHREALGCPCAVSTAICGDSGAVSCNEAVWRSAPGGPSDDRLPLLFVPTEDGGRRLVPTWDSLVPFPRQTEISWWVSVVAHIMYSVTCSAPQVESASAAQKSSLGDVCLRI